MLVTFYLTGPFSATTLSDTFTIVGNPGAETHTGITKTQLQNGYSITFSDSVTGGTVTATNETCLGTQVQWYVNPLEIPTPTPTPTPFPQGKCYSITYSTIPNDLAVRWRDFEDGVVMTQLINTLETMDNGNGTYTAYLCVKQGESNAVPVCVSPGIGGVEVSCDPYVWSTDDCTCTQAATCNIGCY
jgi:hypothetical protein